jgi:transglutaminase-like putative cysteine protease
MRYYLRHQSTYHYAQPVVTSFHRLHISPWNGAGQKVVEHQITVDRFEDDDEDNRQTSLLASADAVHLDLDYWGNTCARLELLRPYQHLALTAWSVIDVARTPLEEAGVAWESVVAAQHPQVDEFRFDSLHVQQHQRLTEFGQCCFTPQRPVVEATRDFAEKIFKEFIYDSQSTDISTPPLTVLDQQRGVCQDFAHLAVAALRGLGLPVAYVSGYLETEPPPGSPRLVGADASHAWFAVWGGPLGWIHADPTNGVLIGDQHIITAFGRDFADVSPVIGIIYGGGSQQLGVGVDVIPQPEFAEHLLAKEWPVQSGAAPSETGQSGPAVGQSTPQSSSQSSSVPS